MKKTIAAILVLCSLAFAAPAQKQRNADFAKMEQIVQVATKGLSGNRGRVLIAAEDNLGSLHLRHWIVTVQPYSTDYKAIDEEKMGILFSGPPCFSGKAGEFCRSKKFPENPSSMEGLISMVTRSALWEML
jgi:hypothetical protein